MKRFQNILFVYSESAASAAALGKAVEVARANDGELTVVAAAKGLPRDWEFADTFKSHLREEIMQKLAPMVEGWRPLEGRGGVQYHFLEGEPFIEIIRQVLRGSHDLVIKAVDESGSPRPTGFNTIDMHLLRKCPCPLWLIRGPARSGAGTRIVAAIDPALEGENDDTLTQTVLELATSLRDRTGGAVLDVLHCWEFEHEETLRRGLFLRVSEEELDRERARLQAAHEEALDRAWGRLEDRGENTQVHLKQGAAAEVIPEFVRNERPDLVVMGTVARTGIAGLLIGNTAESILGELECSVLAVKPAGFRTPVTI